MTTRRKPLIPPGVGQPSISRCGSDAQWLRRANPGRSRSRADSRSGGAPLAPPLVPQGIFVEEPAQQGPPIELPPRSLGLSETIGDRVDCRGIYAEPDMTCLDLDVFRRCGLALNTALPSDNAVGPAKNRCRRHRRRRGKLPVLYAVDPLAAHELIQPPCIRRTRVAPERRTQGDDASNGIRHCLRHFACIDAAEAPTDQRNLPAGFGA